MIYREPDEDFDRYERDDINDEESGFDSLHDSDDVRKCAHCDCNVYLHDPSDWMIMYNPFTKKKDYYHPGCYVLQQQELSKD